MGGVDTFLVHVQGEQKVGNESNGALSVEIDLRMWFHLGVKQRNYLLISHARGLNSATKKEIGSTVECMAPFKLEQFLKAKVYGGDKQKIVTCELKIGYGHEGTILSIRGDQARVQWD